MLEFLDVDYRYKGEITKALSGFNFSAEAGQVNAVLGPNGSGKSTALGIAAGWLKPTAGSFHSDGQVAYLPQSERLAFSFSALEYVTFGRAPHLPYLGIPGGRDRALARKALARVGMDAHADKRVTALSGGELQLVRLARALVQEASWAILDEPTDMLDPAHVIAVGDAIRDIVRTGGGVLLSTHDIAFALAVADIAVLLKDGSVATCGPARETLIPDRLSALYGVPFALETTPAPRHSTARRS
ncbi:MAG: ABC transporter ATP-binding protein [Spirochaetales bacterium]|nr:MAG: ABC transporter ATP-binding protein [Spirochaetales bacterium]